MTRDKIVRVTQMNSEELFHVWNRNMDHRGAGALVFIHGSDVTTANEVDFTIGELRDVLTRSTANHGFGCRWVKQTESVAGIPVVILPPVTQDSEAVPFQSVRRG
jgi:hypothetical protein